MAALATRYVASHGPVTERDLAGWCNQNLTFAREAVALAGDAVTTETIGGQAYLVAADRPEPAAGTPVRLLPGFDEYVLGYKDRSAILTRRGGAAGGPRQERDVPRHRGRGRPRRRHLEPQDERPTDRRHGDALRVAERDPTPRDRAGGSRLRPTSRESRRGDVSGAGRAGPLTQYGGGHRKGDGGHRLLSCW